ncbi:uncharacterized protein CG7065-like isoform X1 [Onthophagus taurus]|uniref:uncharacterized protein CG7065-like isoform X1 n=2 Tax=Onthophagus taurus TaxID=166361 RepID=UPI0039BE1DE6
MMEPAAPGTEDEVPTSVPTYSKKASENERVLSLKAILPNGVYGNVFELSYVCGAEHWYCNMCECPVMGRVYHHEIGKRHTSNTQNSAKRLRHGVVAEQPPVLIAPGEPVPPGFEGDIQKVAQIQDRLDNYNVSPLIGLEYLLEIQEYDRDKEPTYLCMLCDKRGDPRTVIAHLVSYNHICQYLQRHFIKCYQALSPYMTKQYKRNWQNTVNKIAEAVEQRYGRLKPHPVEKEGFEERKAIYWEQIFQGPHFSEKQGVTFENLIVRDEITKVVDDSQVLIQKPQEEPKKQSSYRKQSNDSKKRSPSPPIVQKPSLKKNKNTISPANREKRRSLSSVSSISSSDLSDYEPYEKKSRNYRSRSPSPAPRSRNRSPYRRGRYQRSPSPRKYREKERMLPWQRPDYIKSKSEVAIERNKAKADKLDEFKRLAVAIENDLEKTLKHHERNPEKHPQYNEEWKIFWNKRYKELQNEGKDAANYDFKPEWIVFWNKRMTELHLSDLKSKKDALRRRLGLPDEPAPICFRITGKKKIGVKDDPPSKPSPKPAPMASEPDQDHEVIIIDDKDDDTKSSKRSHSPWEKEKSRDRDFYERSRSREKYDYKKGDYKSDRRYDRRDRREKSRDRDVYRYKKELSWDRETGNYRNYPDSIPNCYKPPAIMRDVTRQPVYTPPKQHELEPEEDLDNGEVNIVAVLRLLTALEEKLGSLGPKVIDMLAQALGMEKNEANSSETLLDNDVNCVLFETVKEKLKGQLLAGLVDYAQEKPFKNAIKKIASLIHFANERKREKNKNQPPKVDPVKVPGIGTVDKSAIAKQIATALVSQGKTDVTQEELEQLINAVVGMAEASKASGKPMTTASFIESLKQPKDLIQKEPQKLEPFSSELKSQVSGLQQQPETTSSMDGLSDSDLQTLLQNFKDLSTEEQHGLITYLKKLESKEPERVERLRQFVNLGQNSDKSESKRPMSPFSSRLGSINPMVEEDDEDVEEEKDGNEEKIDKKDDKDEKSNKNLEKIDIDSEEEYSFDDVFQVAKMNVKEKELEKEKERKLAEEKTKKETPKLDLSDAKALIANIMGSINKKETESTNISQSNKINLQSQIILQNLIPQDQPVSSQSEFQQSSFQKPILNFRPETPNQPRNQIYNQPRNPTPNASQQNVQYPLKNPYTNYQQYPSYQGQVNYNPGMNPNPGLASNSAINSGLGQFQNQFGGRFPFNPNNNHNNPNNPNNNSKVAPNRGPNPNVRGNYRGGRW